MDLPPGVLKFRIKKGVNLAIRDSKASDPYAVIKIGKQKLKTRFIKKDVNPEWDEEFDLPIEDPDLPIKLTVYDHDTFTKDDKMGYADIDIKPLLEEVVKTNRKDLPSGTVLQKIQPARTNCLAETTRIMWENDRIFQDMVLRLRRVERGEVELEFYWIDGDPGASSS